MILVALFTASLRRVEIVYFLLISLLTILQGNSIGFVLMLGGLERSSGGRTIVQGEDQDMLHCLVVGKGII
jgi:hypothetical protein